eukprot:5285561-Prymnesium_polylepis.1
MPREQAALITAAFTSPSLRIRLDAASCPLSDANFWTKKIVSVPMLKPNTIARKPMTVGKSELAEMNAPRASGGAVGGALGGCGGGCGTGGEAGIGG